MGQFVKMFLLCSIVCSLSIAAMAQAKPVKNKKEVEESKQQKKDSTRFTPPRIVKDEDIPRVESIADTPITHAQPIIDFDTTASPDDAFTNDIKTLLKTVGALDADIKVAEQTLKASFDGQNNELITEFSTRFINELKGGRARRWLENLYIRTYRNAYTQKDVQDLIQFYGTPLGKKLVATTPSIMASVMTSSQKIGKYLGQQIIAEIEAEKK